MCQAFNEGEVQNMILKINVLLWEVVLDGTIELVEKTFIFKNHELERNTKRKYECIRNSNMKVCWALSCVEGKAFQLLRNNQQHYIVIGCPKDSTINVL